MRSSTTVMLPAEEGLSTSPKAEATSPKAEGVVRPEAEGVPAEADEPGGERVGNL